MEVLSGHLHAVVDGARQDCPAGQRLELPEGCVHAIWADVEVSFEVTAEPGLGLVVIIPDEGGGRREVPVYLSAGPWASEPPAGSGYTPDEEMTRLRELSRSLY